MSHKLKAKSYSPVLFGKFIILIILISCSKKSSHKDISSKSIKDSIKIVEDSHNPFRLSYKKIMGKHNPYYEISEISFKYKGNLHNISPSFMLIFDSIELNKPKIYFKDLNFDGNDDLMIYKTESDIRNWIYDKYLYDPRLKIFTYHSDLSSLINCEVDTINKILISTSYNGTLGKNLTVKKYKWVKDSLVLLNK